MNPLINSHAAPTALTSSARPAADHEDNLNSITIERLHPQLLIVPRYVSFIGFGLLLILVVMACLPVIFALMNHRNLQSHEIVFALVAVVTLPLLVFFVFIPVNHRISAGQKAILSQLAEVEKLKSILEHEREQVRLERATLRGLFERNNDAVVFLTIEGQHIDVNDAACKMLGYTYEELIQASSKIVIAPDEKRQADDVMRRVLNGERLAPYERTFVHKDGTRIPVEINISLIYDEKGNPLHIQSISRDIRERKQLEQKQISLLLEREKVSMLANLARLTEREIRNPLSLINLNLHLIAKPDLEPTRRAERLKNLEQEITRLNGVLESLGIITQLETGSSLVRQPVEWNLIVELVMTRFLELARMRGQYIALDLADDLPVINGDSRVLSHALVNVLEHALEHAERDTTILLRTSIETMAEQAMTGQAKVVIVDVNVTTAEASRMRDMLSDTLSRKDIGALSQPQSTNAYAAEGTLGLVVARKIMQHHGGDLTTISPTPTTLITRLITPALTT